MPITHITVIAGACIAILGWYVSHTLTARRERDRFRREILSKELDVAMSLVKEILEMAFDYHSNNRCVSRERKIIIAFNRLTYRAQSLPLTDLHDSSKQDLAEFIISFKISITGNHFEDEHTYPLKADDAMLSEFQHHAAQLEHSILKIRPMCYDPLQFIVINYWKDHEDIYTPKKL